MVFALRWTVTGTGNSPGRASVPGNGWGSPLREEGARPGSSHLSPPAPSVSNPTGDMSPSPESGVCGCRRTPASLQRLLANGQARILAVTVSRKGTRLDRCFPGAGRERRGGTRVADPDSRVGVDVGVRVLATVADSRGEVIERVPNPRPLEAALKELRHLSRRKSRRSRGSRRYIQTTQQISRLHRRVADIRGHHIHCLTTRLAKTHGEIMIEGLDAAAMSAAKRTDWCTRPPQWPVRLGTG